MWYHVVTARKCARSFGVTTLVPGIERKTDTTPNGKIRTLADVNLEGPDVNIKSYHCQETVWKVEVMYSLPHSPLAGTE